MQFYLGKILEFFKGSHRERGERNEEGEREQEIERYRGGG